MRSSRFSGVVVKLLSAVETDTSRSNQHEFNGSRALIGLFGKEQPQRFNALFADSDEAAPLFRDDCAPGFRDDLAPCLVGSAGDDCCQFIQARCQALRGRFRRRLSPLNSMRWALWTNLSSMASA
ncbi:hypothetical protein CN203_11605 [Sinorhizobium meliloti]|nr:hypothetical protein CN203_11605 [Sinorhizobium meliloti]